MLKYIVSLALIILSVPAWADITIGVAGPMTGTLAAMGTYMKVGAQLAVEDINKAGGVLGQKLVLNVQDDACEPKQAVAIANKFVNEHVSLIIGHICSGSTMPASNIYNETNTLMIEPIAILEDITLRGYNTVFRVSTNSKVFGDFFGNFISKQFKPKRVVIITEKRAVTQELSQRTMTALQTHGVKDLTELTYVPGEKDYGALVSRVKELAPDAIFCACYTMEGGLIVRQARNANVTVPIVSYETAATDDFGNIIGNGERNVYFLNFTAEGPGATQLLARMKNEKISYDSTITQTYGALQIFAQAANKAGKIDAPAISQILKTNNFNTIIGNIKFNKNGDIVNPNIGMFRWQNGQRVAVK